MPYVTTGAPHHDGVKNEHKVYGFLSKTADASALRLGGLFENQPLVFQSAGGPTVVSDMNILSASGEVLSGVSVKNHKQGSFDYINTSKLDVLLPESLVQMVRTGCADIREKYFKQEDKLATARGEVEAVLSHAFAQFDTETLRKLLQTIHTRNPALVMVNDVKDKKLKCYQATAFGELAVGPYDSSSVYSLKSGRAKSSAQILRNGVVTNLRLRVVLNNGVGALIGLSKSNKNSIPVIKVQQDSVNKVLAATTMYSSCEF
jgi:hypothetical protein